MQLTQDRLKAQLDYDHLTGRFIWITSKRGTAAGGIAGCLDSDGYVVIKIARRLYKAHRLAWLYVHGHWPVDQIDHKNSLRSDNRISNLREASRIQNLRNRIYNKVSCVGARGVHRCGDKYRVRVHIDGKNRHFGTFDDLELAELVAIEARNKHYGEFANHGYAASSSP